MEAARAFAAALLCADGGCGECRTCRLVADEHHPDLIVARRSRTLLPIGDPVRPEPGSARWIVREAAKAPVEGARRVFVIPEFEGVNDVAVPALLKTIEEPPASTVFVLIASRVHREWETILSRCIRVDFSRVPSTVVAETLMAGGLDADRAGEVARLADGRLDRARALAGDATFLNRWELWRGVPERLDGTGAAVAVAVEQLRNTLDHVADTLLAERHEHERDALEQRLEETGERRSLLTELDDQHTQERRRVRTDELVFGLATLTSRYRDAAVDHPTDLRTASALVAASAAVQDAAEALERNPNEVLLLQRLLYRLPPVATEV
jgi:DNA polymerase-3 subunit delta'